MTIDWYNWGILVAIWLPVALMVEFVCNRMGVKRKYADLLTIVVTSFIGGLLLPPIFHFGA